MATVEELSEQLEAVRAANTASLEQLGKIRVKGQPLRIDPNVGRDLIFNELFEAVFPTESVERYEMMIRVETQIGEILTKAKSEATRMMLTEGVTA